MVAPRYAPSVGGLEHAVEQLARGMARRGVQVEVLTTDHTGGLPSVEERDGVLVRRFPALLRDRFHGISPVLGWWLMRNAGRYSVVHAHGYHTPAALQAALASAWRGVPLIVTPVYHGGSHTPSHQFAHLLYRPLGRWLLNRASTVVCLSEAERTLVHRHFGRKLETQVIPPAAPSHAVPGTPLPDVAPDRVIVLSVSRLEAYKQVDRLIRAVPHLPSRFSVVAVGGGPARRDLEHLARQLGVQDRVRFPGRVPPEQLTAWYQRADVFVTLSLRETFGLTLLEAAIAGAPVVASDIPAHREVTGYIPTERTVLVSPSLTPGSLADAIRLAAQRNRVEHTAHWGVPTLEQAVDAVMACYHKALTR
jgi:glycosyltransferase involved in cell wall biosynthesis